MGLNIPESAAWRLLPSSSLEQEPLGVSSLVGLSRRESFPNAYPQWQVQWGSPWVKVALLTRRMRSVYRGGGEVFLRTISRG